MFKQTLIIFALVLARSHSIPFESCKGNGIGVAPEWLTIEGCEDGGECLFYDGDRVISEALVRAPNYGTDTLTTKLTAYFLGIPYDFPMPENARDACNHLEGASCPLFGGEEAIYSFNETMDGILATGKVWLEHAVVSDNGKNYACARFQVNINKNRRP